MPKKLCPRCDIVCHSLTCREIDDSMKRGSVTRMILQFVGPVQLCEETAQGYCVLSSVQLHQLKSLNFVDKKQNQKEIEGRRRGAELFP
jgi:hypothetical protein